MMRKLAEELKENRLKKEITLQQMFVKTRISIKYLEAIENGNFDVLPEVYLKAFIKSYAAAVGLDEDAIVRKFENAKQGHEYQERQEEEVHHAPKEEKPSQTRHPKKEYVSIDTSAPLSEDEASSSHSGRGNLILAGVGILLFVVIVAAYFTFFHHSSKEIVTEKPYEEYIENNKPGTDSTASTAANTLTPAATPAAAASDSLTLKVRTKDLTWVKITADSTRVSEFNLQPNTEKDIKAKRNFKVVLGNSNSVQLMLNNNPLTFSGGKGTVRILKIDSSGIASSRSLKTSKDKNE
ncbi:MAG TPA: RodZ domain-containing protein [Ignavibacteriales bacterium]|nr:RodZ domain-containing protein [Ignavibacteriales bacterium]